MHSWNTKFVEQRALDLIVQEERLAEARHLRDLIFLVLRLPLYEELLDREKPGYGGGMGLGNEHAGLLSKHAEIPRFWGGTDILA